MISISVYVQRITLEWNVSSTMINWTDANIVSPTVVVCKEILIDRRTSFVFVRRVIQVIDVNSKTPNLSRSLSINSSLPIFSQMGDKRRVRFSSSSPCCFSSWLYRIIFFLSLLFVVVLVFVLELVIIYFG